LLLTITLTRPPATNLGYLLHKSPGRVHTRSLAFGRLRSDPYLGRRLPNPEWS